MPGTYKALRDRLKASGRRTVVQNLKMLGPVVKKELPAEEIQKLIRKSEKARDAAGKTGQAILRSQLEADALRVASETTRREERKAHFRRLQEEKS